MPDQPTDHAGLETLPFDVCLRLLASVPIGRVGFCADGEVVVLPVNHAMDGQDVVFRTASGSKLTAAEQQDLVAFEADDYDLQNRAGWSILVTGRARIAYDESEAARLNRLNLHPWATTV
ncbi:MAG TPA: pyridoxamine 5'-phosphate oxidase family protein, partial [Streptosporangiaceae bacterium]|nr:pyridoxamine 5'-phosphate oxidase family protein [Streptosporangiaceae bacterium]